MKPSIVRVIGERIELRKAGRGYLGLCPFHADKMPSLSVSEEKGLFHCFGCGASGDVFDFVMKLDGLTFSETLKSLGVDRRDIPRHPTVSREAVIITDWCNAQSIKASALLREIGDRMRTAKEAGWTEELQLLGRQWQILNILADDLQNPKCAISLFDCRGHVEFILAGVEPEPLPEFPALTPEYVQRSRSYVRGDA